MESFIVRIYRREEEGAKGGAGPESASGAAATSGPVGTVEATATGERIAFHSHQELLSALGADGKSAQKRAAKARPSSTARRSSAASGGSSVSTSTKK